MTKTSFISCFLGIQSHSENGNFTYILCVLEVLGHLNHPLTFGDWMPEVIKGI